MFPFDDMAPTLIAELGMQAAVTLRRFAAGAWNASTGAYTSGSATETPLAAVVQPSGPKEVERLPEAERTKEAITLFTSAALQTSDVDGRLRADQIVWDGRTYEVRFCESWSAQAKYARAIATRVGV